METNITNDVDKYILVLANNCAIAGKINRDNAYELAVRFTYKITPEERINLFGTSDAQKIITDTTKEDLIEGMFKCISDIYTKGE